MKNSKIKLGTHVSISKNITEADIMNFANITLDYNPIHVDEEYAFSARFKRRIAHGMLCASLFSAVFSNKLPGPGSIYISQSLKFAAPAYIGDTITATVEVVNIREDKPIVTFLTKCINQHGNIIVEGEAVLMCQAESP